MSDVSPAGLSDTDRAQLREVICWARANGYRGNQVRDDGDEVIGRDWQKRGGHEVTVLHDGDGDGLKVCALTAGEDAVVELHPSTVAQAVDVLCALGVLPPDFSSAWRAALDGGEVEWAVRVDVAHPRRHERAGDIIAHLGEEKSRLAKTLWDGWTPICRQAGPWREVARDELPS